MGYREVVASVLVGASLLGGCGKSDESSASAAEGSEPPDAALCAKWPAAANTYEDASNTGCTAYATINFCASTCVNACKSTEYGLKCVGNVVPDPSLRCTVLEFPGPAEYCCPCQ